MTLRKIAYLTSGAAGMFCGSCLNDNAVARELLALGHDVQLVPLYTPIRTDDQDVSLDQVFFGGINVYLQQQTSLFRWLPSWLDRWIDRPWIIDLATRFGGKLDYQKLGGLAVSMLRGEQGFQSKEVHRLVDWLAGEAQPEIVIFSNILTAGCVPELKRRLPAKVLVLLQGDDIFLRELKPADLQQALAEIRRLSDHVDGFLAHSRYYADAMSEFLGIDRAKIYLLPLGVHGSDLVPDVTVDPTTAGTTSRPPTVGYLARLAPEKGLHILAEAWLRLRKMPGTENAQLKIAGWMGAQNHDYAHSIFQQFDKVGLRDEYEYLGEVDRAGKLHLLRSIDVLSVPTTYQEPKGLFVLEALAAGVPVVQPAHGAFPEMLTELGGGLLHRPEDAHHLAERLHEMLTNPELHQQLRERGQIAVLERRTNRVAAEVLLEILERVAPPVGQASCLSCTSP
ncbi:Glycogen synthase [Anatilimnocola aggregata]|uniref:Glycogen synthase n=1 Tax=Anatilimnocola aggregata TaxID=2528021 RepID=A0A517Y4L0_9BACT|nr:glycosyltransferase family 4 protein [Anatilimnocola aggregata]QDU25183.1 Glycogen synthase [Anatilimnocola aggregata]